MNANRRRWLAAVAAAAAATTVFAPVAATAAPGHHLTKATTRIHHGAKVRVVVTGTSADAVARAVRANGGTGVTKLDVIQGVAADLPRDAIADLKATPGIRSVTADAGLQLLADSWNAGDDQGSLPSVESRIDATAGYAKGVTGDGIGVALIDSGVTPVAGLDQPGTVIQGPDLSLDSQQPQLEHLDAFGHGTHLAGIIAGTDGKSATDPSGFSGVAPGAHIVSVKVAASDGSTDVSQVIAGIDWAVAHRNDPGLNIRVLNLSFGTESTQSYILDPIAYAVENAWRKGIVVVVAAGNDGNDAGHLTDPAYDPLVLSVGASDGHGTASTADDTAADFSSGGGLLARSPDLLAPGTSVASLRDPGSFIDMGYPTGLITTPAAPGQVDTSRLFRGSGTSQAAAVTSGAVALLLQQRPNLTPDQVKAILKSSATPVAKTSSYVQGSGVLDIGKAAKTAAPLFSLQLTIPATGLGSLEASRGGVNLVDPNNGVVLSGEKNIFGTAWVAPLWAAADALGTAWNGGMYLGQRWTGDTWASGTWDGQRWTSARWSSARWSGTTWSSARWSTVLTSDASWDGQRWSGQRWSQRWTDDQWASARWSSARWSSARWSGQRWSAIQWQLAAAA